MAQETNLKKKMLFSKSATRTDLNILLQRVTDPEPENAASDAGGSSYVLAQPQIALALYWGHNPDKPSSSLECLRGQGKYAAARVLLQSGSKLQAAEEEGSDSIMVSSLTKLFLVSLPGLRTMNLHHKVKVIFFIPQENRKGYIHTQCVTKNNTCCLQAINSSTEEELHTGCGTQWPVSPPQPSFMNLAQCLHHFSHCFLIFKVRFWAGGVFK
jgi:hypothetical protein